MFSAQQWPRAVQVDLVLALALATVAGLEAGVLHNTGYLGTAPTWLSVIFGVLPALPIALRRRAPLIGLIATEVLLVLPHLRWDVDTLFIGGLGVLMIQLVACARYARRPWSSWALLGPVPALLLLALTVPGFATVNELVLDSVLLGAGWGLGAYLRVAAERNLALQGELAAVREAENLRMAAQATQERAAIAREMHDVVGHCVTVMVIQAGSARLQFETAPQASRTALRSIETAGRQALAELRRVVHLLRSNDVLPTPPGLAQLEELAGQLESAGLKVEVSVLGTPVPLPPGIDLSGYRIVQECLTNALKHASAARAQVELTYGDDRLEISVANPAAPASPADPQRGEAGQSGQGIPGMRERAAAYGGEVSARQIGDDFRVHAVLPLVA